MSKQCDYCGFSDPMPFTCKFCGNSYCYNHRLPESHECYGLASYKERIHSNRLSYRTEPVHREPDFIPKRRMRTLFNSLNNAISVIRSNYSLTILVIVIVSFLLQKSIPGYEYYLALYPLDIFSRPWTLVTNIFLHADPIHLLFNMMFLFFFGPELERRIGGKRFLIVFFLSGIIAAIGYSLWSVFVLKFPIHAVGASGALFGIFACLAVIAPDIQVYIYFIPTRITYALIAFAMFNVLFIGSTIGMIAYSAHLSGVIAGLIMGKRIKERGKYIRY